MKHLSTFTHNLAARTWAWNLNKVFLSQIEWCFCVFRNHAKCLYVHVSLWADQSNGSWPLKEQARWNMHDRRESSPPQHTEMFLPPSLSRRKTLMGGGCSSWTAGWSAELQQRWVSKFTSNSGLHPRDQRAGRLYLGKRFFLVQPSPPLCVCVYRATDDGAVDM